MPLFASGEQVYFIDASGPTRVSAFADGPLVVTIRASDGSSLDDLWPEAKRINEQHPLPLTARPRYRATLALLVAAALVEAFG